MLLSLWLLLLSLERDSRLLLAGACVALGAGLLSNEGLFPLALLGFVCVLVKASGQRLKLLAWGYAWLGTMFLLAVRFGVYLYVRHLNGGSYQSRQLASVFSDPEQLRENACRQFGQILTYFAWGGAPRRYALTAGVALAAALAVLWLQRNRGPARRPRRAHLLGVAVAAVAVLLGTAPFVHLQDLFRTQYFAAPAQAALVACVIGVVWAMVPGRLGSVLAAAVSAGLVVNATVGSYEAQNHCGSPVRYERVAHAFEQVHHLSPTLSRDNLVLFVLDDDAPSPLGCNYGLGQMSRLVFGVYAFQANFAEPLGHVVRFGKDGIRLNCDMDKIGGTFNFPYDRVIAFRLATDGNLQLFHKLPARLLPPANSADRYNPFPLLSPGPCPPCVSCVIRPA